MDSPRVFFRSDQLTCNRSVNVNVWKFSREKKGFEIAKVNSRCFCWFPAAMLVPIRRGTNMASHTKLCYFAWYIFSNNSIRRYGTALWLSHVVYVSLFYNISISWLYLLNGWGFYFFTCVTMCEVKTTYCVVSFHLAMGTGPLNVNFATLLQTVKKKRKEKEALRTA